MRWLIPLLFAATPALADTVVANGTIRSMSVIGPADVRLVAGDTPGAILTGGLLGVNVWFRFKQDQAPQPTAFRQI